VFAEYPGAMMERSRSAERLRQSPRIQRQNRGFRGRMKIRDLVENGGQPTAPVTGRYSHPQPQTRLQTALTASIMALV
jgi:hypothetical protein